MKVSVLLLTYNHGAYIGSAIESVLAQQASFPFELVIAEDCSTDGTRDIVRNYASKYPARIRALLPEVNQGAAANSAAALRECRGEYFAALEGDDLWTDPEKLQKQADFLDANPGYSMCGHLVTNIDDQGKPVDPPVFTGENCPRDFGVEQALEGTPLHTSSWMIRHRVIQQLFVEKGTSITRFLWDDPLLLFILMKGKGYCLPEFLGAYRIYSGGTWSTKPRLRKAFEMLTYYYNLPSLVGKVAPGKVRRQIKKGEAQLVTAILNTDKQEIKLIAREAFHNDYFPKRRIPGLFLKISFHWFMGKGRKLKQILTGPISTMMASGLG